MPPIILCGDIEGVLVAEPMEGLEDAFTERA